MVGHREAITVNVLFLYPGLAWENPHLPSAGLHLLKILYIDLMESN